MGLKKFIKYRLNEEINNNPKKYKVLPYDEKPEMNVLKYAPLSNDYKNAKSKILKAISESENISNMDKNYFISPDEGIGFYQVEFRFDGNIKTKLVKPSGEMDVDAGKFTPSDIGTTRKFQNIALYCFVKAGINKPEKNNAYTKSPAEDARHKALVIFKNDILNFYEITNYDDKTSTPQEMSPDESEHKLKKDIENFYLKPKRPIQDSQWYEVLSTYRRIKNLFINSARGNEKAMDKIKKFMPANVLTLFDFDNLNINKKMDIFKKFTNYPENLPINKEQSPLSKSEEELKDFMDRQKRLQDKYKKFK